MDTIIIRRRNNYLAQRRRRHKQQRFYPKSLWIKVLKESSCDFFCFELNVT